MKRIFLVLLTLLLTAAVLVPEASARRRGHRSRRGRGSRRGNRNGTSIPSGSDFFGKRKETRGMSIEPSSRPGPSGYMLSTDYVQTLRSALNESLNK